MPLMQVIVNPVAGKGAGMRESARVRRLLHEQEPAFDMLYTEWPGLATERARSGSQNGCDTVIAIGSDGTANEVLNGFMHARRISVQAEGGLNSHADGEVFMIDRQRLQFEILPQQIDVIYDVEELR